MLCAFQTNNSILFIYFNIIFVAAIQYIRDNICIQKIIFQMKVILKKQILKDRQSKYILTLRRHRLILHVFLTWFEICGFHLKHIDLWSITPRYYVSITASYRLQLVSKSSRRIKAKCEQSAPFYRRKCDVLGFFKIQRFLWSNHFYQYYSSTCWLKTVL